MRELLFVLAVILILLALTAVRYRKQISGVIGLARALNDAKKAASSTNKIRGQPAGVQLVNCSECGVWIPQERAITARGEVYCSSVRRSSFACAINN